MQGSTATIGIDDIRDAARRIEGRVFRTPARRSGWLSQLSGGDVFLKLEVVQPTCSYKIRGAFNAALRVAQEQPGRRLVTASAGNHGRAIAEAARALGLPLRVFIASDAPKAKVDAIRAAGADLQPCRDYDEAERQAKAFAAAEGDLFISPYAHPDVIAGAGTVALELAEDPGSLDAVIVPVGGGGLVSGIAIGMAALCPPTRVIGVEVSASTPFRAGLAAGRIVTVDVGSSIADGLTGNLDPDTVTFDLVREFVASMTVVDEQEVRDALAGVVANEHLVCEGAAAVGVAAIAAGRVDVRGQRVAVVLTGANIDTDRLESVLRRGGP
jgi:threonine dehydratase